MDKPNCVFTICAKNYLAQALALRESTLRHNADITFYIFLSDLASDEIPTDDVIQLDEQWIPNWKEMAFKYNVIEFSTSIKPFCFNRLFNDGYEKVIYLDPDIYVTDSLETIFNALNEKSIVLSPHYCNIQTEYSGCVTEEELLFVGIYNLGFAAIANTEIGEKIVEWWMNRLESKCYADHTDSLHVDQRWMDFIPAFFPNDVHITHHKGINPAIWNLHERSLDRDTKGKYIVRDNNSGETFPLIFFHFSGFDPFNPTLVNRRHPKYDAALFPSFGLLAKEYVNSEYKNGYDKYHPMIYSFNQFSDGENILPLHRRLYREYVKNHVDTNPFDANGTFYKILSDNNLLTNIKNADFNGGIDSSVKKKGKKVEKLTQKSAKLFISLFGIRKFFYLLKFMKNFSRFENQYYLLRQK